MQNRKFLATVRLFFLVVIVVSIYFFATGNYGKLKVSNAYVTGNILEIFAPQAGTVDSIVGIGTYVEKNDLLIQFDDSELQIEIDILANQLRQQIVDELKSCIQADIDLLKEKSNFAKYKSKNKEYTRVVPLNETRAISEQTVDSLKTETEISRIDYQISKFDAQKTSIYKNINLNNRPSLKLIQSRLRLGFYKLSKTKIKAPNAGYVYDVHSHSGSLVNDGDKLLTFIPKQPILVEANVLETDLHNLYPGLIVEVEPDIRPSEKLVGKVVTITPSTTGSLSGIPLNIADSNWIKVSQRVPVLISLDEENGRLLPIGSSVEVTVDKINPLDREELNSLDISGTDLMGRTGQLVLPDRSWEGGVSDLVKNIFSEFDDQIKEMNITSCK